MRILCVSDQKDPLVYSSHAGERYRDVDLILGAGDLELEYYGFIVSSVNKRLFFVFGNHNLTKLWMFRKSEESVYSLSAPILRPSYGSTYIGGKVMRFQKLLIAGLGGSMRYNNGANQYTEFQMYMKIVAMVPKLILNKVLHGRYLDILLTHAPPKGIGDRPDPCHRGFKAFLWFMRKFKPSFLIHGHIHLYDMNAEREHTYEETKVINVFSSYILDIELPDE